ncbi:MAG: hypothetical protein Q9182_001490 [Xanthomendoza sp. 2 TL-2023]
MAILSEPAMLSEVNVLAFRHLLSPEAFRQYAAPTEGRQMDSRLANTIIPPILSIIQLRHTPSNIIQVNNDLIRIGSYIPHGKWTTVELLPDSLELELYARVHARTPSGKHVKNGDMKVVLATNDFLDHLALSVCPEGPPSGAIGNGGPAHFRPRNLGYSDLDPNSKLVEATDTHNVYHKTSSFTNRVRVKVSAMGWTPNTLAGSLDTCLRISLLIAALPHKIRCVYRILIRYRMCHIRRIFDFNDSCDDDSDGRSFKIQEFRGTEGEDVELFNDLVTYNFIRIEKNYR